MCSLTVLWLSLQTVLFWVGIWYIFRLAKEDIFKLAMIIAFFPSPFCGDTACDISKLLPAAANTAEHRYKSAILISPSGAPSALHDTRVTKRCSAQNTARGFSIREQQNIDLAVSEDIFAAVKAKLKVWFILVSRDISSALAPLFFAAFTAWEAEVLNF